jgi:hypothetical protein
MSITPAEQVVADTVGAAQEVLGPDIEAIFTLGSLAHGGFAPLVSDVDVAIILRSTAPETAELIADVQSIVVDKATSSLSARLSLFWADWRGVRTGEGEHGRLGPIDRLDLLDSGHLVLGSDLREPSVRPSHQELVVMSADHMLNRFSDDYLEQLADTQALLDGGARTVTKAILFPVRFMYTLRTGRIGLNDTSAHWYADEELPGSELALQALRWRNDGISDDELAFRMLETDLATIHAECFGEYAKELDTLREPRRAAALADRAARVHIASPDAY